MNAAQVGVPVSHATPPSAICASCRIFEVQPGSTLCPRCTCRAAIRAVADMRRRAQDESVHRELAARRPLLYSGPFEPNDYGRARPVDDPDEVQ